jgi:hypothetical protein
LAGELRQGHNAGGDADIRRCPVQAGDKVYVEKGRSHVERKAPRKAAYRKPGECAVTLQKVKDASGAPAKLAGSGIREKGNVDSIPQRKARRRVA